MASGNPVVPNPRRIFIFDNPRTCSHLFSKLFANHPELQLLYHPFLPAALYGPERYQQKTKHCAAADEVQRKWGTSEEFREWNVVTYDSANRKLVEEIEAAERQVRWSLLFLHSILRKRNENIKKRIRKLTP